MVMRHCALRGSLSLTAVVCLAALLASGCGDFEDPSIIIDLRVLAMNAEPPEVILPLAGLGEDSMPDMPDMPDVPAEDLGAVIAMVCELADTTTLPPAVLDQIGLGGVEVCALVSDPGESRSLSYRMRACAPTGNLRCEPPPSGEDVADIPEVVVDVTTGTIADPEAAVEPLCGTLEATTELVQVLCESWREDSLLGFGGLRIQMELTVYPEGTSIESAGSSSVAYAAKQVVFSLPVPAEKTANQNPGLDMLTFYLADESEEDARPAPLGRCGTIEPIEITAGQDIVLEPVETPGSREEYVVPTFDGDVRMFTENLSYSWYASGGDWERTATGGTRDVAGNDPPLDTEWRSPEDADEIGEAGADFSIWLVQRDERGGNRWYESCVHVAPAP